MFDQEALKRRVACERFSPLKLEIALDWAQIELPLTRVQDAWQRFAASPIASIASDLEKEVMASGIYSTYTIEGGQLSEEETAVTLAQQPRHPDEERLAVLNLKSAYEYAKEHSTSMDWRVTPAYLKTVHRLITHDIPHEYNTPGQYRNNSKEIVTQVGNPPYTPPQFHGDIARCVEALCAWLEDLRVAGVPALIRAPLAHYYHEIIHPFSDGNGRVGRVLEAGILLNDGMHYAPFAQARYYLQQLQHYFWLFDQTRRAHKHKDAHANQAFVLFFLEGMKSTIEHLHDRINDMTKVLLFTYRLAEALQNKVLNRRQHMLVRFIMEHPGQYTRKTLTESASYQLLYQKVTDRTERRDWLGLVDWLDADSDKRLYPRW